MTSICYVHAKITQFTLNVYHAELVDRTYYVLFMHTDFTSFDISVPHPNIDDMLDIYRD